MYKIIKNDGSEKKYRFVPHLFQKIDVDAPLMAQGEAKKVKGFEPVDCKGNGDFSPDFGKESVEKETSVEDLVESAFADGLVKGEKAGAESERKRLQNIFDTFDKAIRELGKLRETLTLNAERGAVELALAIAEKVVSHEVSVNRETLLGVLKEALPKVLDREKIKVRINKLDLEFINESGVRVSELTGDVKDVVIEGDDGVSRGGCIIETGLGRIDARIETQLQAIEDLLRSEIP